MQYSTSGDHMLIANSTALVTGANRGIGRALVQALLTAGVERVYAAARDVASVSDLVESDDRVKALRLDITNPVEIQEAARVASDVSLLINNAAVLTLGGPADVSVEAMRANMETNYFGTLNVINSFIP